MTSTLTAEHRHDQLDTLQQVEQHLSLAPVRRVGLADRLALRVGLALITWGRRPVRPAPSRERLAQRHEQHLARLAREHATWREAHLSVPTR